MRDALRSPPPSTPARWLGRAADRRSRAERMLAATRCESRRRHPTMACRACPRAGRPSEPLAREVTWLEPSPLVAISYSQLMEGRLRDPVYRGLA
jgi:hypothetical protein